MLGIVAVGISGVVYGLLAWRVSGLEAGSALHSINNLMSFFVVAFGLGSVSSAVSVWDFAVDIVITVISAFAIYYIGNKKDWFSEETSESKLF